MSLGKYIQPDLQWAILQSAYAVFGAAIMGSLVINYDFVIEYPTRI